MVDQWRDFAYKVNDSLLKQDRGLHENGCSYVPCRIISLKGLTISEQCYGGVMELRIQDFPIKGGGGGGVGGLGYLQLQQAAKLWKEPCSYIDELS